MSWNVHPGQKSQCCDAVIYEMDGGFWYTCSKCNREIDLDAPPLCPGSFTRRIEEGTETMYGATCGECGARVRVGVGYIQYGNISGALQPHRPSNR